MTCMCRVCDSKVVHAWEGQTGDDPAAAASASGETLTKVLEGARVPMQSAEALESWAAQVAGVVTTAGRSRMSPGTAFNNTIKSAISHAIRWDMEMTPVERSNAAEAGVTPYWVKPGLLPSWVCDSDPDRGMDPPEPNEVWDHVQKGIALGIIPEGKSRELSAWAGLIKASKKAVDLCRPTADRLGWLRWGGLDETWRVELRKEFFMSVWGKESMTHEEIQAQPNSNLLPEDLWSRGDKDERAAIASLRTEVVTADRIMIDRGHRSASSGASAGGKGVGTIRHTPPASSHPTDADVSAAEAGPVLSKQQKKRRRKAARASQNVIESDDEGDNVAGGGRGTGSASSAPADWRGGNTPHFSLRAATERVEPEPAADRQQAGNIADRPRSHYPGGKARGRGDRREPYVLGDDDAGYRSRGGREDRPYWRDDRGKGPRRGR